MIRVMHEEQTFSDRFLSFPLARSMHSGGFGRSALQFQRKAPLFCVVSPLGFEPRTHALKGRCSTN
jgi:hypothetical protein